MNFNNLEFKNANAAVTHSRNITAAVWEAGFPFCFFVFLNELKNNCHLEMVDIQTALHMEQMVGKQSRLIDMEMRSHSC